MECEITTLGNLLDKTEGSIKTGPFGTKLKASEYTSSGVPVISVGEVGHGRLRIHKKTPKVDESVTNRMPEYLLTTNDIVFGRKGAVDRSAQVQPSENGYFLGSDGIRIRLNPKACDPKYIAYQFQTNAHKNWMFQHAAGTTMPSLNEGIIRNIPIVLHDPPTQKRIAHILGTLDDKIELNCKMNETLEKMAQAIFKSWFVDFDPVIDNVLRAGNPIPDELADRAAARKALLDSTSPQDLPTYGNLFPDSFRESELGWIPEGWCSTTLGETCEKGGGSIQTGPFGSQLHASDYVLNGVPSIMPKDLRDNRIEVSSIARIRECDAERLSKYRVIAGDIVYSRRGNVELRSLIRNQEQGWLCGTGCLRVRFGRHGLNPFFGASYLGAEDTRAWIVQHAVGATMPNLNTSILCALPVLVPSTEIQSRFAEIVGLWDEQGTKAMQQSRVLENLRDTLLPKLISGDLCIEVAEEVAG